MHHQRAGASRQRRGNRGVLQLDFGVLDRGAVGFDRRRQGGGAALRRVDLFAGRNAALGQVLIALGLRRGVRRLRDVPFEVGLRLLQRGFERPSIELEERLAFLDVVAFLELHAVS